MKIYLVERNEFDKSGDYDTFENFTAFAPDEHTVKNLAPTFDKKVKFIDWNIIKTTNWSKDYYNLNNIEKKHHDILQVWVEDPNHLRVTYLGENPDETETKIINYYFCHG